MQREPLFGSVGTMCQPSTLLSPPVGNGEGHLAPAPGHVGVPVKGLQPSGHIPE